jgi:hypothetical protein
MESNMTAVNIDELVEVRSDEGDGGWSLHAPGSTDEEIASGAAPYLLSGTAEWVDGRWNRPNDEDRIAALNNLA